MTAVEGARFCGSAARAKEMSDEARRGVRGSGEVAVAEIVNAWRYERGRGEITVGKGSKQESATILRDPSHNSHF